MSSDKKLFAVSALFETPDEIMAAAAKVAERNYENWDVNTPYPVHGMDDAMKLPPTKLAWVTFAMSTFGACFAMFAMWWVMTQDYPLVIGGKPFFAFPDFVPVTFELSVLLTAFGMVGTFLVISDLKPYKLNPRMFDVRSTDDKHVMAIDIDTNKKVEDEIITILKDAGAIEVNKKVFED